MVEVALWGGLSADAGGNKTVDIEAKDIRELLRKLAERYPGLERHIKSGIAVSIDGVIYRDTWSKELPQDAEIYLLPRLAGG
jgi:molybdopterin converting factor small subunit